MGDVPGCNSIQKYTFLCGGNPDSSSGKKNPHTRKLPEVDPSPISPRPPGSGLLANPSIARAIWSRTRSRVKHRAYPLET